MGSAVKLLPYKTITATCEELAPTLAALSRAATGKKPAMRIPATIATGMKSFQGVAAWIEKNRTAYDAFIEGQNEATGARTRGAGN